MSEFLSRLGGAALDDLRGTPLDRILNHLLGGQPGASGLQGLVERLRGAGLGDRVESWIGTGPNRPVQPAELERAFPGAEADRLAQESGMQRPGLLALLSQALPRVIDAMTPDGQIAQAGADAAMHAVPGQPDVPGAASGMGALGGMPHGSPAAAPLGGTGGDAGRQAGQGAGGESGLPRLGPAPGGNTTAPASGALGPKPAGPDRG
ncbi:YidB family protein [Paracraurococcus lichenis]|uniref:YidB family protein n=1 Tax=Paracraurococcus lichenis TaxID=3064888 RepID=A0ABT9E5D9_9PROT|nr:YidB family protein [Paracraurococcus sp. LOR1-02]MDO9711359.1 YidB family protein [Paracraurococcus sp. LOR1-02]